MILRDEEVDGLGGDNGRGSSTVRRQNIVQFKNIPRLRGSKNFISEREKLVLNSCIMLFQ